VAVYSGYRAIGAFMGTNMAALTPVGTIAPGVLRLEAKSDVSYYFKIAANAALKEGFLAIGGLWPNDDFANSIHLAQRDVTIVATNTPATLEPGEPTHHPSQYQHPGSLWWTWTAETNGVLLVEEVRASFPSADPMIEAFTGEALENLVPRTFLHNPALGSGSLLRVSPGENIHLAIGAGSSSTNAVIRLRFFTDPPPDAMSVIRLDEQWLSLSCLARAGEQLVVEYSYDLQNWYHDDAETAPDDGPFFFRRFFLSDEYKFYRLRRQQP
jgi:hypothetical protein